MAHHHHYFTTPIPYNRTQDDSKTYTITIYSIIFIIFCIMIIYNYIKYVQANHRREVNIIYQEDNEEQDGFPDINNFFPAYLDNNRRPPPPAMIPAPPPYHNEERRSLQEIDPPSYESIINSRDISSNERVSTNQSEV